MTSYNAICPNCFVRHKAPRDTRGWIDVARCSKCPPVLIVNGVAVDKAEAACKPLTDRERYQKRERYQAKKKKKKP